MSKLEDAQIRLQNTEAAWDGSLDEIEALKNENARLRKRIANLVADERKMVFVRDTLARADRADVNETTTDRFVVRELRRVVLSKDPEGMR